jgi:hypothetical protein
MRITNSGRVGINTSSPNARLGLVSTDACLADFEGSTSAGNGAFYVQIGAPNSANVSAGLYLQCDGVFGGGIYADRSNQAVRVWNGLSTTGVQITNAGTSWGSYSDERIKTNIENIDSVLDKIKNIRAVKYHLKNVDSSNDKKRIGFIAQDFVGEFDEVLDYLIQDENTQNGLYSLKYSDTIPILLKAIQEQQSQIEELKSQLGGK